MEMEGNPSSCLTTPPPWLLLLTILGLLSLLKTTVSFLAWLYAAFLRPGKDLCRRYGAWAVVTGATDGIGRAIAFELARHGLDLVLVGRNPSKLSHVSHAIHATVGDATEVRTVVFDLAGDDMSGGVERLEAAIEGLDVGVLVNNAGATYPGATYFHEVEREVWEAVVHVNIEAATRVTHAVISQMLKKGKGAVVNIGSGSSVVVPSFPLYAVYAASKAYVDQFSRSLHVEYKRFGIDVQCQIPLYVATKMVSIQDASLLIPSPEKYAKASIRSIGYEARCTPHWPHAIQWFFASLPPDYLLDSWRLRVGIRKRNKMRASMEREKNTS